MTSSSSSTSTASSAAPDGQDVLDVVRAVTRPVIVVLHTVLVTPSVRQKAILDELVLLSDAVVTMTLTAKDRLVRNYSIAPEKVRVIPHGAVDTRPGGEAPGRDENAVPHRADVGPAGRGQGHRVGHHRHGPAAGHPRPRGTTSWARPTRKVLEREGEAYRHRLVAQARELGVGDAVAFDARYLETNELRPPVREADVVLLPYDSRSRSPPASSSRR